MDTKNILTISQMDETIRKINHKRINTRFDSIYIRPALLDDKIVLNLQAEGKDFRLDGKPENRVLKALGLTRKFLTSCEDGANLDLAESAISTAHRGATDIDTISVSMAYNDRVIAIEPTKKTTSLNLSEIWGVLREHPSIAGAAGVTELNNGAFDLKVLTHTTAAPRLAVGDVTHAGVRIRVGQVISMNSYIYRLACSNGMQRMEEGDVLSIVSEDPLTELSTNFNSLSERSVELVNSFVAMDDIVIPNPHEYIMRALKIAGANEKLRTGVVDRLREEAPRSTMYEVLNIITGIARGYDEKPNTRNRIEAVAGRLLSMQAGGGRCNRCDSRVAR